MCCPHNLGQFSTRAASKAVTLRNSFLCFIFGFLLFVGIVCVRLRQGNFAAGVSGEERGKLRPVKVYRFHHLNDLRVFFLDFLRFKVFQPFLVFKDFRPRFLNIPLPLRTIPCCASGGCS